MKRNRLSLLLIVCLLASPLPARADESAPPCSAKLALAARLPELVDREIAAHEGWERKWLEGNRKNILATAEKNCAGTPRTERQIAYTAKCTVATAAAQYKMQVDKRKAIFRFVGGLAACVGATCGAAWVDPLLGIAVSSLSGATAMTFLRAYGIRFLFPAESRVATSQFGVLQPALQAYVGPHWDRIWEKWKTIPTHDHEAMVLFVMMLPSLQNALMKARDAIRETPQDYAYAVNLLASTISDVLLPMFPYLFEAEVQSDVRAIVSPLFHTYFTDWVDVDREKLGRDVLARLSRDARITPELHDLVAPLVTDFLTPTPKNPEREGD